MWLPPTPRMLWVVRCHEGGGVVVGARAVWRWSAAQGLRALGWFADAGWQDLRAVYSQTAVCGAFRMHGAHILPKPAHFGYTAAICCHELAIFPSEATFGMHGAQKLPRIAARERIRAQSCHRQAPGNAFHGHFAISERSQRHSAMCLNVLRRSPIDARAERLAHALRARRSCPRAARHSATTSCTVRGAFVAAEKVSCGLRVSMR